MSSCPKSTMSADRSREAMVVGSDPCHCYTSQKLTIFLYNETGQTTQTIVDDAEGDRIAREFCGLEPTAEAVLWRANEDEKYDEIMGALQAPAQTFHTPVVEKIEEEVELVEILLAANS